MCVWGREREREREREKKRKKRTMISCPKAEIVVAPRTIFSSASPSLSSFSLISSSCNQEQISDESSEKTSAHKTKQKASKQERRRGREREREGKKIRGRRKEEEKKSEKDANGSMSSHSCIHTYFHLQFCSSCQSVRVSGWKLRRRTGREKLHGQWKRPHMRLERSYALQGEEKEEKEKRWRKNVFLSQGTVTNCTPI